MPDLTAENRRLRAALVERLERAYSGDCGCGIGGPDPNCSCATSQARAEKEADRIAAGIRTEWVQGEGGRLVAVDRQEGE